MQQAQSEQAGASVGEAGPAAAVERGPAERTPATAPASQMPWWTMWQLPQQGSGSPSPRPSRTARWRRTRAPRVAGIPGGGATTPAGAPRPPRTARHPPPGREASAGRAEARAGGQLAWQTRKPHPPASCRPPRSSPRRGPPTSREFLRRGLWPPQSPPEPLQPRAHSLGLTSPGAPRGRA